MTIPAIGFGTAPILGRLSRAQSLAALDYAHRLGVRHFDTARSYGWGEAESVLGSFLAGHPRDSYTLVGKGGLVPARSSFHLRFAKSLARQALKLFPASRRIIRGVASTRFSPSSTYDVEALRTSLETSLQKLGTSYLDVLLLHNFAPDRSGLGEVVAWMRGAQSSGMIKRFGFCVEGDLNQGLDRLAREDVLADCVIQVPVSAQLLSLPRQWRSLRFIAHSPFRFLQTYQGSDGSARQLHHLLAVLGEVCKCEAVVCSMFSLPHIEQNLAARRLAETVPAGRLPELFGSPPRSSTDSTEL